MRILSLITDYRPAGGGERYFLRIAKLLENAGHVVEVVRPAGLPSISVEERPEHTIRPSEGLRSGLTAWKELRRIVEESKPHIAFIHTPYGAFSPLVLVKLGRILPMVYYVHDARLFCPVSFSKILPDGMACTQPFSMRCFTSGCFSAAGKVVSPSTGRIGRVKDWIQRFLFLAAVRRADCILVGSRYMREQLEINRFPPEKIHNVGTFLSWDPPDTKPPSGNRAPVILAVGRFDRVKGLEDAAMMLRSIPQQLRWTAQFVGVGPGETEAREIVTKAGLAERVEFSGTLDRITMVEVFRKADIFIMPSLVPESFGMAGMEALAERTPVVAFDSGGVNEWMKDGEFGYLVPRGDFSMMKDKVIQLLCNPAQRMEMGERGHEFIVRKFHRTRHVDAVIRILEGIAGERTRL